MKKITCYLLIFFQKFSCSSSIQLFSIRETSKGLGSIYFVSDSRCQDCLIKEKHIQSFLFLFFNTKEKGTNHLDVAHQAPPSMGFCRQKYWSGLPFPSPGDLPDPGIEPMSPALQADALISESPGKLQHAFTTMLSNMRNQKKYENTNTNCVPGLVLSLLYHYTPFIFKQLYEVEKIIFIFKMCNLRQLKLHFSKSYS